MPFRRGSFRRFGPRVDIPKPVKIGEEYEVDINEVGSKGDGIARIKNFVVFISGAKQGEKTKIKITEVRNRFAIGKKVSDEATKEAAEEAKEESEELESEETEEAGEEE
ncbi:MAG: TRAM domain-containing protein [Candidatus Aenigmatarchaeota archaeon]